MSEFVKQIVEEVMSRNTPNRRSPESSRTSALQGAPPSTSSQQVDVTGISRPNYQRDKKAQRLKPLTNMKREAPVKKGDGVREQGNVFSQLKQLSLVQGRGLAQEKSSVVSAASTDRNTAARLIGKTRGGSCVWFFPVVRQELQSFFNVSTRQGSVGVVTANACYPGQLFLVEEILKEIPVIQYHLEWENERNHPFVCELYSEDSRMLEKVLKNTFQKLNRLEFKGVDTYTVVSPSAWLSRRLQLDQPVHALGVVEGVGYYHMLQLLDRYLKKQPDVKLQFKIETHYTLLVGEHDTVSAALESLRQGLDLSFRY